MSIWHKKWRQKTIGRVQNNITSVPETGKGLSLCIGPLACGRMLTGSVNAIPYLTPFLWT
jgi:hypothetical protein